MTCYDFTWNWRALFQRRCYVRYTFIVLFIYFFISVEPLFDFEYELFQYLIQVLYCVSILSLAPKLLLLCFCAFNSIFDVNKFIVLLMIYTYFFTIFLAGSIYWTAFWSGPEFSCNRGRSCDKKGKLDFKLYFKQVCYQWWMDFLTSLNNDAIITP